MKRADPSPQARSAAGALPKRLGTLLSRTSRILSARTLEELVTETAEAARRILRAARAVAFVQTDGVHVCSGRSPRWNAPDTAEPTRAVPLVGRDGHRLGALQVWARDGVSLSWEDEQVLQQIAHCAATIADTSLARPAAPPGEPALVAELARMVHDLRTPLTAMLSWTWALKQGLLDGRRAARALEAIERNARTQARILDEAAERLRAAVRAGAPTGALPPRRRPPAERKPPAAVRRVRDVMTTTDTLAPGDTVGYAAERLRTLDVDGLPVCEGGRLLGMVTERDVAVRVVAEGRDPRRTAVIEVADGPTPAASAADTVEQAVQIMRSRAVRRLPVVDEERRFLGIVTIADLAPLGPDRPAAAGHGGR